jgi:MFS family permease
VPRIISRVLGDRTIALVYLTILLLGVSYGLALSIAGVFLEERGFDKPAIGWLVTFFAAGIGALAVPSGALLARFGPKRVLVVSLIGYGAAAAAFPFMESYVAFGVVRFFDGAFSVGVWVSSETILLARAPKEEKAFFMSVYAIALAAGYVIGPLMNRGLIEVAPKAAAFYAGAAVAAVAAVVCAIFLDAARSNESASGEALGGETTQGSGGLTTGQVFKRIRAACFATFSYGYFQASVAMFLPLYLIGHGMTEEDTILIPAFFAGGMLSSVVVAGRLADKHGHLFIMRVLGSIGTAAIVSFVLTRNEIIVYALVFIAGASLAALSPVSLGLQGRVLPPRDLQRGGGLYNAAYGLGMCVGPPISGTLFKRMSGDTMILHFAGLWAAFVIATVLWRKDDPRLSAEIG